MYIHWKWEMTFKIRCGGNLFFGSVVGSADDFGLGCDLGFVCVWSLFVIWVCVCVWSLFFFFFVCVVVIWVCVCVWSLFLFFIFYFFFFSFVLLWFGFEIFVARLKFLVAGFDREENEEQVVMVLWKLIMTSNNFFN